MGGGGKDNKAGDKLGKIAKQFFGETTPLRNELIDQMMEALTTGGVGARIPLIGAAEEKSRQATSNTLRQMDQSLAQSGLAGTPFGEMMKSQTRQGGQQQLAQISPNYIGAMLQQIPGFVQGTNQNIVSGFGQAGSAQGGSQNAFANMLSAMLSPFNFNF
jgi:hypothetical protein